MKKIIVVGIILFLLFMPYFISAKNENNQWYNVYEKKIFIFRPFWSRIIDPHTPLLEDTFTTPLDCKQLGVEAEVGPYLTGEAVIYIEGPDHREHTLWGTGFYVFGRFVSPALRVFYDEWFTPGLQWVTIRGEGYGYVTFWVNGTSG